MKISQLRNIIKESIKELMKEDTTTSYNDKVRKGKCRCENGQVYTCEWLASVYNNFNIQKSCCETGPPPSWCLDTGGKVIAPGSKEVTPSVYKNLKIKTTFTGGVIKENITKLDNYALEIYSDFRKDPSIHFPDVEFEVDEEGFALENDSNYSQLKKYKREIMGLHALFGEESGVKDKNGLQLSMYDVIDNI